MHFCSAMQIEERRKKYWESDGRKGERETDKMKGEREKMARDRETMKEQGKRGG